MRRVPHRLRRLVSRATREISARTWLASHGDFLLILNWHQITPHFDSDVHHRYTWTALNSFAAAVDYLTAHFRVVPLHEALKRIERGSLGGRCVALTFDDGDVSMADFVMPLLRQRNLPATFFINTAYLDGGRSYWFPVLSYAQPPVPGELQEKALKLRNTDDPVYYDHVRRQVEQLSGAVPKLDSRLVSEEWLAGLDGDQFAIGAHGHEHERYSMMPPDWQRKDLSRNVAILSRFRAYRPLFAVPFGRPWDWNSATLEIAHELGLDVLLADGGVNLGPAAGYCRQPADSQSARDLITQAIRGSLGRGSPRVAEA
jgi:peptidoglycan/xylan/chitin deacetylase (PgdA/CDA1 family)